MGGGNYELNQKHIGYLPVIIKLIVNGYCSCYFSVDMYMFAVIVIVIY